MIANIKTEQAKNKLKAARLEAQQQIVDTLINVKEAENQLQVAKIEQRSAKSQLQLTQSEFLAAQNELKQIDNQLSEINRP